MCVFGNTCETLFVEIHKPNKNLLIGVCYRPPGQPLHEFTGKLYDSLNLIDKEKKDCIILGDFNTDLRKVDSCNLVSEFLETFVSYLFEPLINSPTRFTETSKSLIDNIFVNSTCGRLSGAIVCDISDHFPVFSFFDFPFKLKNKATYVDKRIINEDSIRTFLVKLDEVDFDTMFGLDALTSKDPNDVYDNFVNIVLDIYNVCFPYKKVRIKQNKNE